MGIYQGITPRGALVMVFASLGGLLFGFDNGWWGTVLGETAFLCDYGETIMVKGVETCNLSTSQQSAGTGVGSAGIMLGCALAMYINNLIGRQKSIVTLALISIVGIVVEMTSATGSSARYGQFLAGKTINSIAMGIACNVVPIYLSETSVASARGFVINMYQMVQIIGVIVASGSVYAVAARLDKSAYLIPMGIQFVAPTLILLVVPFIPESPRWLVWVGRKEEAIRATEILFKTETNGFDAVDYVDKLDAAFHEAKEEAKATGWGDLARQPDLRRVLIAIGIQSLQQAQGSSYMTNYIVSFLVGVGVVNVFPVIMGLYCLYFATICTGNFLPDIFGRRPILLSTSAFCAATLIIVSILTTAFADPSTSVQKASIALIFLWYASFGAQSPLIWIVTAEAAPTRNREKVLGLATFCGFGVQLIITFVAPYLQDVGYGNLGSKIGFIWGAFSMINIAFVFFFVPETKGHSLEQLDYLYENRVATRKFKGYHFDDVVLATSANQVDEVVIDKHDDNKEDLV
ncbi:uncharacterized protein I303_104846 [Kwoniella dejecticola CBS 10117]|uniref:Major facilitator superfamily (MFS) profile domain-containing protein n=1 Tax=Kwoniella dejecticola CBS 10117 TaxID=1296121 RepID=A0A1A6A468_9TREE|nr:uncharacterized protein I303_04172 [Kwoniella dejecticola CBS 10117]OBR84851.1 hypothetical protein I303_04172 [Kwoniella dejecticola CBS 10117]